jgi:hypothetical protein
MRATRKKRGEVPTTSRRWVVEGSGEGEKVSRVKKQNGQTAQKNNAAQKTSVVLFSFSFSDTIGQRT